MPTLAATPDLRELKDAYADLLLDLMETNNRAGGHTNTSSLARPSLRTTGNGRRAAKAESLGARLDVLILLAEAPPETRTAERLDAEWASFWSAKDFLNDEVKAARAHWDKVKAEYESELERLAEQVDESDEASILEHAFAADLLIGEFDASSSAVQTTHDYLMREDFAELEQMLTAQTHRAQASALIQAQLEAGGQPGERAGREPEGDGAGLASWPGVTISVAQDLSEASGLGLLVAEGAMVKVRAALDRTILYHIQSAVLSLRRMGMSESAVAEWAHRAYERAGAVADELVDELGVRSPHATRWGARLRFAGNFLVVVDIGHAIIDVRAAPHEQKVPRAFVHTARISSGIAAGAAASKVAWSRFRAFGPKLGGLLAVGAGLMAGVGAQYAASKGAELIADEIWPSGEAEFEIDGA